MVVGVAMYRPSGTAPVGSILTTLAWGLATTVPAVVVSATVAHFGVWGGPTFFSLPVILTLLGAVAPAALVATLMVQKGVKSGHMRNPWMAGSLALIVFMIYGYLFHTAMGVMSGAWYPPQEVVASATADSASFAVSVFLIGLLPWEVYSYTRKLVYCEHCSTWCETNEVKKPLIKDWKAVRAAVRRGDLRHLLDQGDLPERPDANKRMDLKLSRCATCDRSYWVTVIANLGLWKERTMVRNLLIDAPTYERLTKSSTGDGMGIGVDAQPREAEADTG